MDAIASGRRTVRDRVRRRVLTTVLGFIDNRATIRRAAPQAPDHLTAHPGHGPDDGPR